MLRGADGNGICRETNLPSRWSTNENVRWRVPLPDRGNSTPIVWSNRVFVTQAIEREKRRTLMCFDRRAGKLLWQRGPIWTDKEVTHPDNPPCTPSPVTDGERVIAWFGSAGVYCFDFDGRELWRRDLGPQKHEWGYASSPVLYLDFCFLNFGPGQRSFVIALEKKTGATVWQRDAPTLGANAKWTDFGGQDAAGGDKPGQSVSAGTGARNASWSAPVLAGGRLYVANRNADVFVLRASPKFECVATNSIGGEPMNASLAISDGNIFIRTDKQLWCIGDDKE